MNKIWELNKASILVKSIPLTSDLQSEKKRIVVVGSETNTESCLEVDQCQKTHNNRKKKLWKCSQLHQILYKGWSVSLLSKM